MDRGSRVMTLFQSLEKLNTQRMTQRYTSDDIQQLRYLTSKMLQLVASQDKLQRDLLSKNQPYMEQLLSVMENCSDSSVRQNLVYILQEFLSKTSSGKRASTLVSHGTTQILFQVLVSESRDQSTADELLVSIHQVLAKLGPKDRKFGVKARLGQALPVTLALIRQNMNNLKFLQPVLHVLKLVAANAVNASYLGKNGAVTYMFKILSLCGRKHLTVLKYATDTLVLLVKSKSNSARAIGHGGVPVLLTMYYDWHRIDSKNRHIGLRKSILNVLKHITNLKSGRKALMDADGIRVLYNTCQEAIDSRELESVIFISSLIMRKCFPKNRLPLSSLKTPLQCPLPESDFHNLEWGNPEAQGEDNGYESSIDNDDDLSSDDDPETRRIEAEDDVEDPTRDAPYKRTPDDLMMYNTFFPEMSEFEYYQEETTSSEVHKSRSDGLIVMPNTSLYNCDRTSKQGFLSFPSISHGARNNQSGCMLQNNPRTDVKLRYYSVPNLSSRHLQQDADIFQNLSGRHGSLECGIPSLPKPPVSHSSLSSGIGSMRISAESSDLDSVSEISQIPSTNSLRSRMRSLFADNQDVNVDCLNPSAVNLKTGSSVFSLDVPSNVQSRSLRARSAKRVVKSAKSMGREKQRSRLTQEEQDFAPSLSITPIPATPRMTTPEKSGDSQSGDDDILTMGSDENGGLDDRSEYAELYTQMSRKTISVGRFNKLAYPDMYGHIPPPYREPLHEKKFGVQRGKIFEDIDRMIHPDQVLERVVYNLDSAVSAGGAVYNSQYSSHSNNDAERVSQPQNERADHLKFNSQFESGNLRKVIQMREHEYDLILGPDVNTNHHHQWFYFEVSNMEAGVKYRFNIINNEKLNSQFNFGMKPLMYSVKEAVDGRPHWLRVGKDICYYKNHFTRSSQTTGGIRGKTYFTTSFSMVFKHSKDVCYLAYHYPYTYTALMTHLARSEKMIDYDAIYYRHQTLCHTVTGNQVPVLTVTSYPQSSEREAVEAFKNKPYIFLSGRVHPGESNSSWVMKGTIDFLLSDKPAAQNLRDMYIFKIVPMLNPDGVLNGCHRCSVVGEDLNRRWLHPCPKLHPTIYHSKGLLQYLHLVGKSPLVYCDYHGHSRRKNVFLYGCSPSLSWMSDDTDNPSISSNRMEDTGYKTLPRILQHIAPSFSLNSCSFMVEKSKEATARVVVWRQIGVVRSYTMESSYCGCDQGTHRGSHIGTREHEEMGRKFCEGLARVRSRHIRSLTGEATSSATLQQSYGDTVDDKSDEQDAGAVARGDNVAEHRHGNLSLHSNSDSSCADSDQSEEEEDEEDIDPEEAGID